VRPELLFPLFAPLSALKGVGPRFAKLFESLAGPHVVDLCWHLPNGIIDRRYAPKVAAAIPGRVATLTLRVGEHQPPPTKRQPYRVSCHDDTGELELVFFHARPDYLNRMLPEGEVRVVSGKLEVFNDRLQITHPDHIATVEEKDKLAKVEPVYHLTAGLSLKVVGKAVQAALARTTALPEWLDPEFRKRRSWAAWHDSLLAAHAPDEEDDLLPLAPARTRLAYDELPWCVPISAACLADPSRATAGCEASCWPPCRSASRSPSAGRWRRSPPTWPATRACCGCCRATWAAARPWWPCWP
jgi:ATP-dependent DNA helicase RecG